MLAKQAETLATERDVEERTNWVKRMLAALGNGVKGGGGQYLDRPRYSLHRDSSPKLKPECWRANHDAETTNWRAVCGRTARTVRREGRARAFLYPYLG